MISQNMKFREFYWLTSDDSVAGRMCLEANGKERKDFVWDFCWLIAAHFMFSGHYDCVGNSMHCPERKRRWWNNTENGAQWQAQASTKDGRESERWEWGSEEKNLLNLIDVLVFLGNSCILSTHNVEAIVVLRSVLITTVDIDVVVCCFFPFTFILISRWPVVRNISLTHVNNIWK